MARHLRSAAASPFQLRLFSPDPEAGDDSPAAPSDPHTPSETWRVRTFYERFALPYYLQAKDRDQKTIAIYRQAVRLWEELTDDPPLCEITQEDCLAFVHGLGQRPGLDHDTLSPNTIRKLCTHLQKVFDLAGPRDRRHNRQAAGLLPEVPYLERPEYVRESPHADFSLSEIGLWLGACAAAPARLPATLGIRPSIYFPALISFVHNTGLRIDTTMSCEWGMVDCQRKGWLTIPAAIFKGKKHGHEIYLNRWARAAIETIRLRRSERLFPWVNWPGSQSWLQEQRRRQLAEAGIPERRRFGFHGLRATLLTWLGAHNGAVATMVAGHSTGNVAINHYINPEACILLLDQVPQAEPIQAAK